MSLLEALLLAVTAVGVAIVVDWCAFAVRMIVDHVRKAEETD